MAPRLVCLLPARNCAEDLPGYFASVERVADAVVALDDGSTDETAEFLRAHPLVHAVLANPRRTSFAGWDDAFNRNRLLAAAAELEPGWVLSLDADERIDAGDAAALRSFLEHEAREGHGYLFRVFRMINDEARYDGNGLWLGRLFSYEPGQTFPDDRLHFVPLPTAIPRSRWIKTTFRIQHLAGLTEERRRLRFEKYREADPDCAFQANYENLLRSPRGVKRWQTRSPHLPATLNGRQPEPHPLAAGEPLLSAIVISMNDEATIERTLRSIVDQQAAQPFEVIVVNSGSDGTARIVRETFPDVKLVKLERPALPGRARNAGLHVARGRYVSFPGSHVELPPGSLAARMRAHERGYAMVTGTMVNGTRTWAGWASYFLDNRTSLPGRPSEELRQAPARCSYLRAALLEVGGFPEDVRTGEDTLVNTELFARGYGAFRSHEIVLVHRSPCRRTMQLLGHHFRRGRGMARVLLKDAVDQRRFPYRLIIRYLLTVVPARLFWITVSVVRWGGGLRGRYVLALPLVAAGAVSAWAGTWLELLREAPATYRELQSSADDPGGRPAIPVADTVSARDD